MLVANESRRRVIRIHDLLSIKQAAEYKGVSTRAVYQRINRGDLPVVEADKVLMVYRRDLDEWQVATAKQKQDRKKKAQ